MVSVVLKFFSCRLMSFPVLPMMLAKLLNPPLGFSVEYQHKQYNLVEDRVFSYG